MTIFLKAAHSSGTRPAIVGVIFGGSTKTFSRNGKSLGGGAVGGGPAGDKTRVGSEIYNSRVAVEGSSPKSAALVGKPDPLEGGQVDRLEDCRDECPEPACVAVVE